MATRTVAPRLSDIVEAIDRVRRVLAGVSLDTFEHDWEKRWLVERGLEIISEASRHLTPEIKARHPEIPWPKVAGIGNILRHEYARAAPDIFWRLARDDLPSLDQACREELAATRKTDDESA